MPQPNETLEQTREMLLRTLVQTAEGRTNLASSMQRPIRERLNHNVSLARKILRVNLLSDEALMCYDNYDSSLCYNQERPVRGNRIYPPEFEIRTCPTISINQLHSNLGNSFDKLQSMAIEEIKNQEDRCLGELFKRIKSSLTIDNFYMIFEGIKILESKNLKVSKIITDYKTYANLQSSDAFKLFNIDIEPTTIFENEIYIVGEREFTGVIPIRRDIICSPYDNLENSSIGVLFSEVIGMFVNPNAIVRMKVDMRTEEEKKTKRLQRYRFISKR